MNLTAGKLKLKGFWCRYWRAITFIITGFLVVQGLLIYFNKDATEAEILSMTELTLKNRGFTRIRPQIKGRDVILKGRVSSESSEKIAIQLIGLVKGVRRVQSQLEIAPLRLPHLKISRTSQGKLMIEGEIPDQQMADELITTVIDEVDNEDFINLLKTDPEVTEPVWLNLIPALLAEANQLQIMEIEIGAGQFSLSGLLEKQSDYNVMIERIIQFSAQHNMEFLNKIGIHPSAASLIY